MRRLLILLFTLAFTTAGAAAPAAMCVSRDSAGVTHGCCGGQRAAIAPAADCCTLAPHPGTQALVEARTFTAKPELAEPALAGAVDTLQPRHFLQPTPRAQSATHGRSSPIYLEYRSLLI